MAQAIRLKSPSVRLRVAILGGVTGAACYSLWTTAYILAGNWSNTVQNAIGAWIVGLATTAIVGRPALFKLKVGRPLLVVLMSAEISESIYKVTGGVLLLHGAPKPIVWAGGVFVWFAVFALVASYLTRNPIILTSIAIVCLASALTFLYMTGLCGCAHLRNPVLHAIVSAFV